MRWCPISSFHWTPTSLHVSFSQRAGPYALEETPSLQKKHILDTEQLQLCHFRNVNHARVIFNNESGIESNNRNPKCQKFKTKLKFHHNQKFRGVIFIDFNFSDWVERADIQTTTAAAAIIFEMTTAAVAINRIW